MTWYYTKRSYLPLFTYHDEFFHLKISTHYFSLYFSHQGADVNHSDSDGRTALHVAAFCVQKSTGHSDIVACLLNHGANPNLPDSEGITPLLGASNSGNYLVCELCLESDADVNMADK